MASAFVFITPSPDTGLELYAARLRTAGRDGEASDHSNIWKQERV